MQHLKVIYNPTAGRGRARRHVREVEEYLRSRGARADCEPSTGPDDRLERGVMLLFDYGLPRAHYYHPQRTAGTLRCHFKQRVHDDPYINVGVQDITAWVDFTRVAEAALACGLEVGGLVTQAAFLLATGIEGFLAEAAEPVAHARLAGEARRLLLPGEMGEAFKVMALTRECDAPLAGLALQDLRRSL